MANETEVVKFSISMTPRLYTGLTAASLDKGTNESRQIETYLRESPSVKKYPDLVESEPEAGAHLASPRMRDDVIKAACREGSEKLLEARLVQQGVKTPEAIPATSAFTGVHSLHNSRNQRTRRTHPVGATRIPTKPRVTAQAGALLTRAKGGCPQLLGLEDAFNPRFA